MTDIDEARQAIEQNIATPSWRERTYRPEDGTAPFFQDYVVWNQFDGYRNLVKKSALAEIAAQLMSSETARIFHDHILVKEPGNSIVTPWHQASTILSCGWCAKTSASGSRWAPFPATARSSIFPALIFGVRLSNPSALMASDLFEGDTSASHTRH